MKKVSYFKWLCVVILFLNSQESFSACLGGIPLWGTGDDRVSCAQKRILKKEEKQLEIKKREAELEQERQKVQSGVGHGSGNTNVVLGGLRDMINGGNQDAMAGHVLRTKHQVRVELMPYVIPGAYQFDKPGTPEHFFINGLAWEYYVDKNLGFGFLWQEWSKKDGRSFDPIIASQRDGSGDTAIFFPGDIDRISYRSIIPYVAINAELGSPFWVAVGRVGIGPTQAKVDYKSIDVAAHPYAYQPDSERYQDSASLMIDLAIEHWTNGGTRMGFALRYINARYETDNYLEYINMGSAQAVFYVQFMLKPLGVL
jgi:hypothetical protein